MGSTSYELWHSSVLQEMEKQSIPLKGKGEGQTKNYSNQVCAYCAVLMSKKIIILWLFRSNIKQQQ